MLIEIKEESKQVPDAETAAEIFRNILSIESEVDQGKEHFWVIGLNNKNIILYVELAALGTLNNNLVHPRETFRMAILKAAASIIVGHNHPSGSMGISQNDREVTLRLKQAGEIIGIKLIDHIVIGNNKPGCLSFQREGLLREVETEKVVGSDQNAKENILEQIEVQRNNILCDVFNLETLAKLSIHAALEESEKTDWVSVINLFSRSLNSIEENLTKMEELIFVHRKKTQIVIEGI